jgi:hypothetical protein
MSDLDATSELQRRLVQIETTLVHIRRGKAQSQPVDPMVWRTNTNVRPAGDAGSSWRPGAILRCLRDDWNGLSEAIRMWGMRVEKRFCR